jgi:putative membrane protein
VLRRTRGGGSDVVEYLPLALTGAALALHLLGERRAAALTGRPRDRCARSRALTFYAGLLAIFLALGTPIETLAEKLLWAHMIEHLLLLLVAAPLIVLGAPWMSLWRPLPLGLRRALARTIVRSPWFAPIRSLCRALGRPLGAWLAFSVNLVLWHLPALYDLTLRNTSVHALEHITFLLFGVVFWAQVIDSAPAKASLSYVGRIGYVAAAIIPNVGVSMLLAFSRSPLYAPYAELAHRPGGISALADQQIAAGIMWSVGDLPFGIAIALLVHLWLTEHELRTSRLDAAVAGAGQDSLDGERPPGGNQALEPDLEEAAPPTSSTQAGLGLT